MRRSPILADFLKIAQTPALPDGALDSGGKRQITVADIDLCRAQLNRRHDEDGTKDRCDVIVRAANLGESATIKGLAKDTQHKGMLSTSRSGLLALMPMAMKA